ncbi:MAG: hypothetical protein JWM43_1923 [Acidobacteriaceae bacterium]|nr:hypothetical protein [Acidobacteriaceae bacterium]
MSSHCRIATAILSVFLNQVTAGSSAALTSTQETTSPYTITVPVNEVSLTFHASDYHGSPLDDLKVADVRLSDNGRPQTQILSFQFYPKLPIQAGILFDTSRSMLMDLKQNQHTAALYATHLLRKGTDRAFVMRFDSEAKVLQDWTDDSSALVTSLQTVASDHASRFGGTVIFDSIYEACRDQWRDDQAQSSGNFILLFTDGIDNASHTRVSDVANICQRSRTALYVFSNEEKSRFSEGQKILTMLVAQSGGRIFFDPKGTQIWENLQVMESDQRSQYRLVYKPSNTKPDGSFHRIKLDLPKRGGEITGPSGYYASR